MVIHMDIQSIVAELPEEASCIEHGYSYRRVSVGVEATVPSQANRK